MTPDQLALGNLRDGDVEEAVNTTARMRVSNWVSGCVELASHRFVEAAARFFADGRLPEAVAALLLDPWNHFARLSRARDSLPPHLAAAVDSVLAERPLGADAFAAVMAQIPAEAAPHVPVAAKLAEFNLLCIIKVAESASMATIAEALPKAAPAAHDLLPALIESGRITAKIDQVADTVEFQKTDQSARQTSHLLDLFERIEQLTATKGAPPLKW